MPNALAGLLAALQVMLSLITPQVMTQRLRSGTWLRLHVVAQDDTARMQHVKLCVRDAVQQCYADHCDRDGTPMLAQAQTLLPLLTDAAVSAAREEGFTGTVDVALSTFRFDDRELYGAAIPAGEYPALMIRLGDAQGRNWWGLLDPELALLFCRVPQEDAEEGVIWDWSFAALWAALFGASAASEGA